MTTSNKCTYNSHICSIPYFQTEKNRRKKIVIHLRKRNRKNRKIKNCIQIKVQVSMYSCYHENKVEKSNARVCSYTHKRCTIENEIIWAMCFFLILSHSTNASPTNASPIRTHTHKRAFSNIMHSGTITIDSLSCLLACVLKYIVCTCWCIFIFASF